MPQDVEGLEAFDCSGRTWYKYLISLECPEMFPRGLGPLAKGRAGSRGHEALGAMVLVVRSHNHFSYQDS